MREKMSVVNYISQIILPLLFVIIIACGFCAKTDIYSAFTEGAKDGLKTVAGILPSLIGLIMAVGIFRASGAMDILISLFNPLTEAVGFPNELVSLGIMKMFSSSAATGILLDIFKNLGPDSLCGIAASIMMSCTETVFYTLSIYSSAGGLKNTKYTAVCALIANLSGIAVSFMLASALFFK